MELPKIIIPIPPSVLSQENQNPRIADFIQAMGDIKKTMEKTGRVYATYVTGDYIFLTTSKDVHLELGVMSFKGQYILARLLEDELTHSKLGILVFDKGQEGSRAFFVARTDDEKNITSFSLSPTH